MATDDERFLREAIALARAGMERGDGGPFGCVIVKNGAVIGRGNNRVTSSNDPTAHAEVVAMRRAAFDRRTWRLDGLTAYVTLEPCAMCAGAFVNARITRVVYGCDDPRAGALRSLYRLGEDARLNHRFEVVAGVRADACADILRAFFRARRGAKRPTP